MSYYHHAELMEGPLSGLAPFHKSPQFLAPQDLTISQNVPNRLLCIGSCALGNWNFHGQNPQGIPGDFLLINHVAALPEKSDEELAEYDLILVQLALRFILPDSVFWNLPDQSNTHYQQVFDETCDRLKAQLAIALTYTKQLPTLTLVMNFQQPVFGDLGRFQRRYHLSHPTYFIDKLNEVLENEVRAHTNAYLLDVQKSQRTFGTAYFQDDVVLPPNHNSILLELGQQYDRIQPIESLFDYFLVSDAAVKQSVWAEVLAMWRTYKAENTIKLVVTDLDDTLWKGLIVETDQPSSQMIENWHLGYIDALATLKRRGILLAILSKNDEQVVAQRWNEVFGQSFPMSLFSVQRINWEPKVGNMKSILSTVNLLPQSVLFVDDNPVERAHMREAFPSMRILGAHPLYLRKVLLASAETQVQTITLESQVRAQSMASMSKRALDQERLGRESFIQSLHLQVKFEIVNTEQAESFPRLFELLNKTNQFNTTGRRWTAAETHSFFADSGVALVCYAKDKYANYGLISVALLQPTKVVQWVLSCRVFGIGIEEQIVQTILDHYLRLHSSPPCPAIEVLQQETPNNMASRAWGNRLLAMLASQSVN